MKIQITSDDRSLSLRIPTGLLFSKPMIWMGLKFMKKSSSYAAQYIPENPEGKSEGFLNNLPEEAVYALCAELRHIKKTYGSWELVDVRSSDGEIVKIIL